MGTGEDRDIPRPFSIPKTPLWTVDITLAGGASRAACCCSARSAPQPPPHSAGSSPRRFRILQRSRSCRLPRTRWYVCRHAGYTGQRRSYGVRGGHTGSEVTRVRDHTGQRRLYGVSTGHLASGVAVDVHVSHCRIVPKAQHRLHSATEVFKSDTIR